jgi:hypothetical protein
MDEKIEKTRVKMGLEMQKCEISIESLLKNLKNDNSNESINTRKKYLELYFTILKTITILDEWKYDLIQNRIADRSDFFHLNRPLDNIRKLFNERKNILNEYSTLKDCFDFNEKCYLLRLNTQCEHILSYKKTINVLMDGMNQSGNDFDYLEYKFQEKLLFIEAKLKNKH